MTAKVESKKHPGPHEPESTDDTPLHETAAALHSLSAEVLHEITHTLTYLRCLVEQDFSTTDAAEALGFARNEIARLERLVGNLRQFKLPPAHLSDVPIAAIVEEAATDVKASAVAHGLPVSIDADAKLIAQGNRAALWSALRNLLLNAIESSPAGDTVHIRAGRSSSSGTVQIEISYGGSAIPTEQRKLLFHLWTLGPMDAQALRRVVAFRLLRHIGWTVTYDCINFRNIFHVTALAA